MLHRYITAYGKYLRYKIDDMQRGKHWPWKRKANDTAVCVAPISMPRIMRDLIIHLSDPPIGSVVGDVLVMM